MASIHIRYKNGEFDEWELHDAMDLKGFAQTLKRATGNAGVVSFAVASERGGSADLDFVGVSMAEVASWHIAGLYDDKAGTALWAELQG